jgi:threonine aldolase
VESSLALTFSLITQSGVLAAAGLVALEDFAAVLSRDHRLAHGIASAAAALPGIEVSVLEVETNMVVLRLHESIPLDALQFCAELNKRGVLALPLDQRAVRMVTHRDVRILLF